MRRTPTENARVSPGASVTWPGETVRRSIADAVTASGAVPPFRTANVAAGAAPEPAIATTGFGSETSARAGTGAAPTTTARLSDQGPSDPHEDSALTW